jgi:4-hydroxy-3-methylbut-2-enyl diphosphate reductase
MLLVVGGYNSSNTTHLAEIGEREKVSTFFVRNAECLRSAEEIAHYDLHSKQEIPARNWLPSGPLYVGITAGASCPNYLIEDVIRRLLELRGETAQCGAGA